ncbi:MAG TPA: hypothetical protein VN577_01900 [Terriglobales bacterium]|nr:hypothetical protein [Terriglobales bacterium]
MLTPYFVRPVVAVQLRPIAHEQIVYYHLEPSKSNSKLPEIHMVLRGAPGTPAEPGSGPAGSGNEPKLVIAVRHPQSDNRVQTILQPAFPPEIKIKSNVSLPDIVPIQLVAAKPSLAPPPEVIVIRKASEPLPIQQPPRVAVNANDIAKLRLPQGSNAVAVLAPADTPIQIKTSAARGDGGAPGLLVLNQEAGPLSEVLAVPAGNRYGDFTLASDGGNGPGGGGNGKGSGGPGTSSTGAGVGGGGTGKSGGGGGTGSGNGGNGGPGSGGFGEGGNAEVTIAIAGGGGAGGTAIRGGRPESLNGNAEASIFPISKKARVRKAPFLIAAGPGGGGGLDVYGALRGGKIYTIFLNMPGKAWILQYCAREGVVQKSNQVTFNDPVAPPDATEEFDFQRVAVKPEDRNKLIVLKARIGVDGLVGNLILFRGVQAQLDALALKAFAKWHFIPATRGGQPLPVEVLVGIPVSR